MAAKYVVQVINEIADSATVNLIKPVNPIKSQPTSPITSQGVNATGQAISAQFLVEAGSRLIGSIGQQEVAQMISKTARYTFLSARALTGDVTAIATLAVSAISELTNNWMSTEKARAVSANNVDDVRMRAGLLDISNAKMSTNFFTGRYRYDRG